MLTQPLLDKLTDLGLAGFRSALEAQLANPQYAELTFEERLGLLVDQEHLHRQNVRLARHLKAAAFQHAATVPDLDLGASRGLDRRLVLELAAGEWVHRSLNVIVLGATGVGKTFLACALGHAACLAGYRVRYERTSWLLYQLTLAHADGSYPKLLAALSRFQLLILDDWLRDPLTLAQARDLLEVLDDRDARAATLVATQVPVTDWHQRLPDPTLGDAVLDRLVQTAYRLELRGESRRKTRAPVATSAAS